LAAEKRKKLNRKKEKNYDECPIWPIVSGTTGTDSKHGNRDSVRGSGYGSAERKGEAGSIVAMCADRNGRFWL
jgi:hypothetical protein